MSDERWLSAAQATARLGVKPQTLYAYVSRGLVRRERPPGSRTSRYARRDVERLAEHGRPRTREGTPEIVIDQAITPLDPAGHLAYRGWDVTRAAVDARYEEVAAWLWGRPSGRTSTGARTGRSSRSRGRCRPRCPPTRRSPIDCG